VGIAMEAQKRLAEAGVATRVVSMPCTSAFDRQDAAWREAVLPKGVPRVAVEAGVTDYWRKYVGLEGAVIGVDRFGESAPAGDVYKFLGIDAEHVVAAVQRCLA
jgi:transketolase